MLLVRMHRYLKSVLRYTFIILDNYNQAIPYVREQRSQKWSVSKKCLGITGIYVSGLDWWGSGLGVYVQSVEYLNSTTRD